MYRIDSCPCCQSTDVLRWPALVSPFLSSFVLEQPPSRCALLECSKCSLRFYDVRLDAGEIARLYAGYRGENYFRVRHRFEPWYSRAVNSGIGHDAHEVASRKSSAAAFLKMHLDLNAIDSVLDYGGDQGQFIPEPLGRHKYVFEISDVPPVAGVTRIPSEASLAGYTFDCIMICNVLEHCSDPAAVMREMRKLGNDSTMFYVELPWERFNLGFAGKGRLQEIYLDILRLSRIPLTVVDFVSTAMRVKFNTVPPFPFGLLKVHEHLNYFNQSALAALLEASGFVMVGMGTAEIQSSSSINKILQAVVRPRPA